MTLTDSDLSDLLAAIKAGEMTDTIRTSLEWVLQQLIEAEATAFIGAARHERSDTRTAQRYGQRPHLLSTAAGDVELGIPKLRQGSSFPSLLRRRRRIDRALYAVVMEAWVHGVSTRRPETVGAHRGAGQTRRTHLDQTCTTWARAAAVRRELATSSACGGGTARTFRRHPRRPRGPHQAVRRARGRGMRPGGRTPGPFRAA